MSESGYVPVRLGAFAALVGTPAVLLAWTLAERGLVSGATGLETLLVLTGGVAATAEYDRAVHASTGSHGVAAAVPSLGRTDAAAVSAAVAAAVLTHVLGVHVGFGPVVASALVGLVAGLVLPEVDAAAYCGSFVGMASVALFSDVAYLVAAGLLAGLAFVVSRGVFDGYGGKLGTTAFFGCATTAALTTADYAVGSALPWAAASAAVPVAAAGAVATTVLSRRFGVGSVVASALVGLVAGLVLPPLLPGTGATLATVAFCASFAGMSSTDRLGSLMHVALAGGVSGVVFVGVTAAFPGAGGKLGTVAFVSCVSVVGLERLRTGRVPSVA
ncbi:hypothetical protein [Halospeciosus flavus]|uniref:Urea transporter n=1 Tax=Halospeciosus flavus TaxID=3032283 RepID=A0ABD5Z7A8_9EURY|nr:hypothetical protein [Halospeciosus flavus]